MNKIILALALTLAFCTPALASDIPYEKAVKAILGEAGQTYEERLAIAFALRNRGHLKGVYGHLKAPSEAEWQEGARAWSEAQLSPVDPVKGADHWLSDWDLKHAKKKLTAFRFKMVETAYIGNTHFYKKKGVTWKVYQAMIDGRKGNQ